MFIHADAYKKKIQELIEENDTIRIAAAFWGEGAEQMFQGHEGKTFQIICNLTMGGTNPEPIQRLMETEGVEVKMLNDLHAKVVLGKDSAIVGSANFSTNGLSLEEDEAPGWREAGLLTQDPQSLQSVNTWFKDQWRDAETIDDEDMEKAQAMWEKRRRSRPRVQKVKSLMDAPLPMLKNLNIAVLLFRSGASQEAMDEFRETKEQLKNDTSRPFPIRDLDCFEDADDLPKNTVIIGIRFGSRGKLHICQSTVRFPQMDVKPSKTKRGVSIQYALTTREVEGMHFGKDEKERLYEKVLPHVKKIWGEMIEKNETKLMPLYDFMMLLKSLETK